MAWLFLLLIANVGSVAGATVGTDLKPVPVVLDTDIGTDIDDTWALVYLLNCPEFDLKMVLTSSGDTTYRAKVAARMLEIADRSDVAIAVGPDEGEGSNFQAPWVEDYELSHYPGIVRQDGVQAFIELVKASDVPVTVIAIGPVPSLQKALELDPSIAGKIRFYGMHGSIDRGYENEPSPEANVRSNVPAFRAVLEADFLHKEITPLDTCAQVVLRGDRYQKLRNSELPLLKALFENYTIWSGLVTWMHVDPSFVAERSSTLFDLVAVYMAMRHDFLDFEAVTIRVTEDGFTVRDASGIAVDAAMAWKDLDGFYEHVTQRLLGEIQP